MRKIMKRESFEGGGSNQPVDELPQKLSVDFCIITDYL